MRLETATARLRPRAAWEATDLGVALARHWSGPVYAAWFALALPLFLLLHLLCWGHWWLVPWLLWWLKPLLDRTPLYILSQALFGDVPDRRRLGRELPGLLRRQAFAALTWRRFDPARSFTLPVQQLEGLTGKARRQRLRDLGKPGRGPAVWLTVICAHLEVALDFALIVLVWMLIPDFVALEFFDLFDDSEALGQLWLNGISLCGMSLVEPFYVAAGFALYLNRRTELEAWDLELGFRRLAGRLAGMGRAAAGLAVLGLSLGLLAIPATGFAVEPVKSRCEQRREREAQLAQAVSAIKQALAETLREPELQPCAVQEHWQWREDGKRKEASPGGQIVGWAHRFAATVEFLLWFALGMSMAFIGFWLWRRPPGALSLRRRCAVLVPPSLTQGCAAIMTLPDAGLGGAAWRLWSEGQPRAALRLLYRGSLAGLATQYGLPIPASATEDEGLRLAGRHLTDVELLDFFRRLTHLWQATAYAHRPPDEIAARNLCEAWPRYFATTDERPR